CSGEKRSAKPGHIKPMGEEAWKNSDQRQENCAGKSQSGHGEIKKVGSRLSRSHTGDVPSIFLQIVRDLSWLKLRGDPEVTEKENHSRKSDIMRPASGKRGGDAIRSGTILKAV